ncbi:hypothetical protein [Rhizobium mongolense]|uniref:Uncharacterized protein n=2 Tax=Rhizobium mongolense TaxID=57676 RepID=A0ABR6IWE8_9HYPH|nr:hypothetical protein [Rhizobium mongolense]MBB4231769.1 hypothetical protein [Rhizobium mongolense]TVZ66732.1 hypothetical protein BCL32_7145 [Rhizobium mongolense USDA 1844]
MWIELNDDGDRSVYVNMDNAMDVRRSFESDNLTEIMMTGGYRVLVVESPNDIMSMISEEQRRLAHISKTAY